MTHRAPRTARPVGSKSYGRARFAFVIAAVLLGFSAPAEPKAAEAPSQATQRPVTSLPPQTRRLAALEVGLAGAPVVGADGGWWLLGRDGEVERHRADDSLFWSISINASITGAAATDDRGQLIYVPTARDHVVAIDVTARVHWRYRAPAGIVGPVAWVPKLGLVFVGRDRSLYWLDNRANLVLRVPLKGGVSSGPTPFGDKILVGTEQGQLLAFTRQGQRQSAELGAPAVAITATKDNAFVLAGSTALWFDKKLSLLWSEQNVLGIGVTAAHGRDPRPSTPVIVSADGQARWLDSSGQATRHSDRLPVKNRAFTAHLAATESLLWMGDASGVLWEAHAEAGWTEIRLGHSGLYSPLLDASSHRVFVGTFGGSVWCRILNFGGPRPAMATSQQ